MDGASAGNKCTADNSDFCFLYPRIFPVCDNSCGNRLCSLRHKGGKPDQRGNNNNLAASKLDSDFLFWRPEFNGSDNTELYSSDCAHNNGNKSANDKPPSN